MKTATLMGSAAVVLMNWVQPAPAPAIFVPLAIGVGSTVIGDAVSGAINGRSIGSHHSASGNRGSSNTGHTPAAPSAAVELTWNSDGSCDMWNLPEASKTVIDWYLNHPDIGVLEQIYGKVEWTGESSVRFWDYPPHDKEIINAVTAEDGTIS